MLRDVHLYHGKASGYAHSGTDSLQSPFSKLQSLHGMTRLYIHLILTVISMILWKIIKSSPYQLDEKNNCFFTSHDR